MRDKAKNTHPAVRQAKLLRHARRSTVDAHPCYKLDPHGDGSFDLFGNSPRKTLSERCACDEVPSAGEQTMKVLGSKPPLELVIATRCNHKI